MQVLVRPRIGSFVYTPEEVDVMLLDIEHLKPIVDGFVVGALTCQHQVDVDVTTR
jgi:copper homeostasis protein